jgi:hypothetical protein
MAHKQRTPFTLKSGNAAAFKNMGSSPVQQNIFSDRPGYDAKAKRAKFKSDVGEFVGGIHDKLQQFGEYTSPDAIKARREARLNKKAEVNNVAEKSTPISPSDAKEAMGAFNPTPPEPPKQNKTYIMADESNNTPSPKVKVRRGALEQQIIKTAEKPGKGIGPWQATKFPKMNTELKLSKTFNTKATTTEKTDKVKTKKVRNKPKPGESQYQADVRVAAEERRASRIAKKEAEQIKLAEPVDLTKQTGLGPRV